ncbi:MAG: hypothetical protein Q9219_001257 [cf. Caloplaca sp. 3 TL-2023]
MTKSTRDHKPMATNDSSAKVHDPVLSFSDIRNDQELWYRLCVLLHDLNNVKDRSSEKRLSLTVNELYISEPYFTEHEACRIRAALVDCTDESQQITIEQALHRNLENFLDKRRASGDSRPCGPHDLVPAYCTVLGITKDDLKDEQFIGRLRRSGLGDSRPSDIAVNETSSKRSKGKGKA